MEVVPLKLSMRKQIRATFSLTPLCIVVPPSPYFFLFTPLITLHALQKKNSHIRLIRFTLHLIPHTAFASISSHSLCVLQSLFAHTTHSYIFKHLHIAHLSQTYTRFVSCRHYFHSNVGQETNRNDLQETKNRERGHRHDDTFHHYYNPHPHCFPFSYKHYCHFLSHNKHNSQHNTKYNTFKLNKQTNRRGLGHRPPQHPRCQPEQRSPPPHRTSLCDGHPPRREHFPEPSPP